MWRGVPQAVDKDAFWWQAPDGSVVRAQYLWPEGYGNGARLPEDGKGLVEQVRHHLDLLGDACTGSLLWIDPRSKTFLIFLTSLPQDPRGHYLARCSNAVAAAFR